MSVSTGRKPQRGDRVLAQSVTGTLVLLGLDNGRYYALNDVGRRIWEMCDGEHSVSRIVSLISDEYGIPANTARADVLELLDDLAQEKLVI